MNKWIFVIFSFFLGLLFFSTIFADTKLLDKVIISVEKQSITQKELEFFYQQINQENIIRNLPALDEAQKALQLKNFIDELLFVTSAFQKKIKVSFKETRQAIENFKTSNGLNEQEFEQLLSTLNVDYNYFEGQFRRKILVEKLIKEEIDRKIIIKNEEIKNEYEQKYKKEEKFYFLRHILLKSSSETAKNKLKQIRETAIIKNNFPELAKKFSEDITTLESGGSLPALQKNDMLVEIANGIEKLAVGDISKLVKTPLGYHLFYLEDIKVQSSSLPLEQLQNEIRKELYVKKHQKKLQEYRKNLMNQLQIVIKDNQLKELLVNYADFQF